MSALRTVVLACGFLVVAGPALAQEADLQKQILGKWQTTTKDVTIQFEFKEKEVLIRVRDFLVKGTYKIKGNILELEIRAGDKTQREKSEVKISGDTMEWKAPGENKIDTLKRVK